MGSIVGKEGRAEARVAVLLRCRVFKRQQSITSGEARGRAGEMVGLWACDLPKSPGWRLGKQEWGANQNSRAPEPADFFEPGDLRELAAFADRGSSVLDPHPQPPASGHAGDLTWFPSSL